MQLRILGVLTGLRKCILNAFLSDSLYLSFPSLSLNVVALPPVALQWG